MSKEKLDIIQSKGSQMFTVPNGVIGREFIRLLRVYLADSYKIRTRGRAKNRRATGGNGQDPPRTTSDWLAVYVEGIGGLNLCQVKHDAWRKGHADGVKLASLNERTKLRHRIEELDPLIGDCYETRLNP